MQAAAQKQSQKAIAVAGSSGANDSTHCFQVREKLDAIFDGKSPLEQTFRDIKQFLFAHLEICRACCRAFDVRMRFRQAGRDRIY